MECTATAHPNVALIKYWGKEQDVCDIHPLNSSLSVTLGGSLMQTETHVDACADWVADELYIDEQSVDLSSDVHVAPVLSEVRRRCPSVERLKFRIRSNNSFPLGAGLASSASGVAAAAAALCDVAGVNRGEWADIARRGSGSACRSIDGGFVLWDHQTNTARHLFAETHWPDLRILVVVAEETRKPVSSRLAMRRSVETSELLRYRAETVVPQRIAAATEAIRARDFHSLAELVMRDSNQLHAICMDSYPPVFYLNAVSHALIATIHALNDSCGRNIAAYSFDAGPNCFLLTTAAYVPLLTRLLYARVAPLKRMTWIFGERSSEEAVGEAEAALGRTCDQVCEEVLARLGNPSTMYGSVARVVICAVGSGVRIEHKGDQ